MPETIEKAAPSARAVAQMRAMAAKAQLAPEVADMLAARPGVTVGKAEKVAARMAEVMQAADQLGIPADARRDVAAEMVAAIPKGETEPDPEAVAQAGTDAASELKVAMSDQRYHVPRAHHDPMNAPVGRMGRDFTQGPDLGAKMAHALAARMSRDSSTDPGPGREFADMPIPAIAMAWEGAHGRRHGSEYDAVRAVMSGGTHSSSDFIATVIGASVDLELSRRFQQQPAEIARASREITRDDYRAWRMVRMGSSSALAPIGEGGEFRHTTVDDEGEDGPRPQVNGRIFRITEEALANDRVGALDGITIAMLQGAVERVRSGLCEVLVGPGGSGQVMRDGEPLFHADHGNLAGTGSAISITSVGELVTAMRRQKGPGGEALALVPRFLIVPPELETQAWQFTAEIDATEAENVNPFAGRLEVLVEPGLADTGRWYLAADPAQADGLAHAVVGGGPRVESKLGWETATVEFRVRLDIGFGALDWRALAMNPGA